MDRPTTWINMTQLFCIKQPRKLGLIDPSSSLDQNWVIFDPAIVSVQFEWFVWVAGNWDGFHLSHVREPNEDKALQKMNHSKKRLGYFINPSCRIFEWVVTQLLGQINPLLIYLVMLHAQIFYSTGHATYCTALFGLLFKPRKFSQLNNPIWVKLTQVTLSLVLTRQLFQSDLNWVISVPTVFRGFYD